MSSLNFYSDFYFSSFVSCNCWLSKNENLSLSEVWSKLAFYGLNFLAWILARAYINFSLGFNFSTSHFVKPKS
jgi:hypothetical protein